MTQKAQTATAGLRSGAADPGWRAFVEKCLVLDLEVVDEEIREVGALWGKRELRIPQVKSQKEAVQQISAFGEGAGFLVGHNLVAHDRRFIQKYLPGSVLLHKPTVDTLYLSPLARPQRPYHNLVKDYKLVGAEPNNPLADCRLALKLLEDCWGILQERERDRPWLLSVYRSCFDDADSPGGSSPLKLNGTGHLLAKLGGRQLPPERVVKGFVHFAENRACATAIHRLLPDLLAQPETRPAIAYSLAWLTVSGMESVLPRWVHHTFPKASALLREIRGTHCGDSQCCYCSEHHDLHRKLRTFFPFDGFRPTPKTSDGESLQERIVTRGIKRRPLLAILPTGGGKSLGFQLPAIIHNEQTGALTVVVSPLQALMKDQVDNLNHQTRSPTLAATLNGMQTLVERRDVLEEIRLGRFALLYVSPEQLRNSSFVSAIRQREIASWVFDEAHCISKWGHDFRPDYLYAARFIREFSEQEGVDPAPIACFTATAKLDVQEEIQALFRKELDQELKVLAADRIDRENLRFLVEEVPNSDKWQRIDQLLRDAIADRPGDAQRGAAIIYARSRRRTEHFAERLRLEGWNAEHFHAGLEPPDKKKVQDAFIGGALPIIVATNAFGMGIDKDNVRLVVHADVPGSIESYLQETGRAGRDGQPADCVLLFNKGDLERQFDLVSRGQLTKRDIAQILRAIRRGRRSEIDEIVVSPGELLRTPDTDLSFDEEDRYASTRVKTAISWLERAGFVLRNQNRTRLFQGVPAVADLKAAISKMNGLRLSPSKRRRWTEVLERLHRADVREGIEVDEIALLSSFKSLFGSLKKRFGDDIAGLNRAVTREIFAALHEMTSAGLLTSGLHFSAWIRHKTVSSSTERLKEIAGAQHEILDLLRAQWPDISSGEKIQLSIPQLQEQLRAKDLTMVSDGVLTMIRGWSRTGPGEGAPTTLQSRGRHRMEVTLEVPWDKLSDQLELRNTVAEVVLDALSKKADEASLVGVRLLLFSLDDLQRAVDERLGLARRIGDPFNALEKTLLFLDENHVIQLQSGLSIFRQAMTIRLLDQTKGRRYSEAHYRPLQDHYQQRVFQIHAIGRYVEEAQKTLGSSAHRYVDSYFRLSERQFRQRYFRDDPQSLIRAISSQSYKQIVEDLKNEAQVQIVTAAKESNQLVLAGPGSGKTRVVVHRAAYLLMVERIRPQHLLVICFNRSAMHELRVRLRALVGDLARGVAVHTYHSLALRITERSIADRVKTTSGDRIDFDKIIKEANSRLEGKEQIVGAAPDELRDRLLSGFEYVLVDEYQDIDADQYEMITHIARRAGQEDDEDRRATILAVGDDDQNIYAWRHANVRYLRQFEEEFKAERHYLVENYRSTRRIINAANVLIGNNKDRMKVEHPIRINTARAKDPPGGDWQRLDRQMRGRVSRIEVDITRVPAATLGEVERLRGLGEVEHVRGLGSAPDWQQFAILAWSHAQLAPVRGLLEKYNIPVRRSIPDGLPRLDRIREFRLLLDYLGTSQASEINVPQLRQQLTGICRVNGPGTVWTGMADRILAAIEDGSGVLSVPAMDVTETLRQGLADHNRSHLIGHGVLVSTIHAAKGLEFDHVLVLGGLRENQNNGRHSTEEERRLYYVGMTRARQTLALIDSRDSPNPYFAEVGSNVRNRRVGVATNSGQIYGFTYGMLGMADLWLDFAGRQSGNHSIHRALSRLQHNDRVCLKRDTRDRVWVLDRQSERVARLSSKAATHWPESRLEKIEEVRVLGMAHRTQDDSGDPKYRDLLQVESWEVPILEVRERQ